MKITENASKEERLEQIMQSVEELKAALLDVADEYEADGDDEVMDSLSDALEAMDDIIDDISDVLTD